MRYKASLKMRTAGREEIRVRRKGRRGIRDKETSVKGGRLKISTPTPRKKKRIFKKLRKY